MDLNCYEELDENKMDVINTCEFENYPIYAYNCEDNCSIHFGISI